MLECTAPIMLFQLLSLSVKTEANITYIKCIAMISRWEWRIVPGFKFFTTRIKAHLYIFNRFYLRSFFMFFDLFLIHTLVFIVFKKLCGFFFPCKLVPFLYCSINLRRVSHYFVLIDPLIHSSVLIFKSNIILEDLFLI